MLYPAPCPSAGVTVEGGNIVIQVQVSSVASIQGNLKQESAPAVLAHFYKCQV
jgi:hypothetical protein